MLRLLLRREVYNLKILVNESQNLLLFRSQRGKYCPGL